MKKTLVALAALAAVSAFAQSTATLSGVVRFGYQKAPNETTTTKADTGFALTDATFNIGLAEDLGGGLKAAANMTFDQNSAAFPGGAAAVANNAAGNGPSTGSLNRRNTSLSLTGGFGRIGFAQTRSSDLLTQAMVAPSNLEQGLYNTSGIVARGGIDAFSYGIQFDAITAGIALIESNNDGVVNAGRLTTVVSLGYANGPIAAGLAFKNTNGKNGFASPAEKSNTELFATYDLGVAKLGFGFDSKMNAVAGVITAANAAKSAVSLGVSVPLGAATLGLNYAKRGTAKVTEFAANYALSKRTSINASFGNQTASAATGALVAGTGAAGGALLAKQSQYRISMAHSF